VSQQGPVKDGPVFSPELESLLREVAADPQSMLLRTPRPRLVAGYLDRSLVSRDALRARTLAEGELLRVHREELAAALRGRDIWSFMRHLAHRWRVVLTPGERFGTGEWSVRACLPSVEVATARELGRRVSEAVSEFAAGIDCPWCEPRA